MSGVTQLWLSDDDITRLREWWEIVLATEADVPEDWPLAARLHKACREVKCR